MKVSFMVSTKCKFSLNQALVMIYVYNDKEKWKLSDVRKS